MTVDPIALTRRLIACRSVTPDGGEALDIVQLHLAAAGFQVRRLPFGEVDNLWATLGTPKVLFAGHVDVVPPGDLSQWRTDPFVAVEKDGVLFGRGAADMKSAVAAMTAAAASFAAAGGDGIAMLLTSDEEGDAVNGTQQVVRYLLDSGIDRIPCAVVGEPSCEEQFGDAVKIARRGSLTVAVDIRGRQSHAAYAQPGDNPIHLLVRALQAILPPPDAPSSAVAAQIVAVQGGAGADNVVPSRARATINFRYTADASAENIRQATESTLRQFAAGHWRCKWKHGAEPFSTDGDCRLVKTLRAAVAEVCGVRPKLSAAGGTSDGRFLKILCPQVAEFGVVNKTIHQVNECVRIEEVRQLTAVYERLMHLLAGR